MYKSIHIYICVYYVCESGFWAVSVDHCCVDAVGDAKLECLEPVQASDGTGTGTLYRNGSGLTHWRACTRIYNCNMCVYVYIYIHSLNYGAICKVGCVVPPFFSIAIRPPHCF